MNKKKLNNKGFAITTILFGILILFLLLLLSLLSILSLYKDNLEKLIDVNNGGREIATMTKITKYNGYTKESFLNAVKSKVITDAKSGLYCFSDYNNPCIYISTADLTFDEEAGLEYNETFNSGDIFYPIEIEKSGYYYIQAHGAAGGTINYKGVVASGGKGGYTSGYVKLVAGDKLYFFVGEAGNVSSYGETNVIAGGYNGGGAAKGKAGQIVSSGGGASDVRFGKNIDELTNFTLNNCETASNGKTKTCEVKATSMQKGLITVGTYTESGLNTAKITVKYKLNIPDSEAGAYQRYISGNLFTSGIGKRKNYPSIYNFEKNKGFNIEIEYNDILKENYDPRIHNIDRFVYSRLEDRIMVAAGGGGATFVNENKYSQGGNGGNLSGQSGKLSFLEKGTWKTKAGGAGGLQTGPVDTLGAAGGGFATGGWSDSKGTAGGGGGYNGGKASANGGGGGSSYISGYAGVNSVGTTLNKGKYSNSIVHTPFNDRNIFFVDTEMYDNGTASNSNSNGDGEIFIEYVGDSLPSKTNSYLNNVRFIRDCINGSSSNSSNHWVEIQAIANGQLITMNKASSIFEINQIEEKNPTLKDASKITDGTINTELKSIASANFGKSSRAGLMCVTINLGSSYNLDEIAVWHYYQDGRQYKNKITYVSSDEKNWVPVIDLDDTVAEDYEGFRVSAWDDQFIYSIKYSGTFITKTADSEKTYASSYARFTQNNWSLKLITSGTLEAISRSISTDAFLVGGGGGGSASNNSGGGGGGYVKTVTGFEVERGNQYKVEIGAGGAKNNAGGTTKITLNGSSTPMIAVAGGAAASTTNGGDGGSGGGGGGNKTAHAGGTNGENGTDNGNNKGGIGCLNIIDGDNKWRCANTYAFEDEEFDGIKYASGGQGGKVGSNGAANTGNGGGGKNKVGGSGVVILKSSYISTSVNEKNQIVISISSFIDGISDYCVTKETSCSESDWLPIIGNKAEFTTISYDYGNYYVYIKDGNQNVYKSTIVRITQPFSFDTYDYDITGGIGDQSCDGTKFYISLVKSGTLEIKNDVKVDIFMVSAGQNGNKPASTTNTFYPPPPGNYYYNNDSRTANGASGGGGGNSLYFTTTLTAGTYKVNIGTNVSNVSDESPDPSTSIYYNDTSLINIVSNYQKNGGVGGKGKYGRKIVPCNNNQNPGLINPGGGWGDVCYGNDYEYSDTFFDTTKMIGGDGVKAFGGNTTIPTLFGAGGAGSASIYNTEVARNTIINGGVTGGGASGYYYFIPDSEAEEETNNEGDETTENNTDNSALATEAMNGKDGTNNTGAGGGAAYDTGNPGIGGSGIIIIRAYNSEFNTYEECRAYLPENDD